MLLSYQLRRKALVVCAHRTAGIDVVAKKVSEEWCAGKEVVHEDM